MICPICSEDIDNLESHKKQEHDALEVYDDVPEVDAVVEDNSFDEIYGEDDKVEEAEVGEDKEETEVEEDKKESEEGGVGSGPQGGKNSNLPEWFSDPKQRAEAEKALKNKLDNTTNEKVEEEKVGENWDDRTQNDRVLSFEALGFTQGDSMQMAEISWTNLSTEVQNALEVEEEDKEDKREEDTDIFNDESSQPDTQIEEEDGIDYNIIGESLTSRSKYECEWCNSGFKSNESLLTHFNDTHVQLKANEFSIDVPLACPFCMEDLGENETMGEHLAYTHGISSNSGLKEEPMVEDNMVSDVPTDSIYEFNGKTKLKAGETHDEEEIYDEEEKQQEDELDIVEEGGVGSGPQKTDGGNDRLEMARSKMEREKGILDKTEDYNPRLELKYGYDYQEGGEGGVGSGPQGGTALLPEQAAMANINPNYDAFSKDEGDPFTAPMIDSESLATEEELTKPLDEIEEEEKEQAEETDENDEIYEDIEDIAKDTAEEEINMIKGGNDYTKTHDFYGNKSEEILKKKIKGIEVYSPTQIMGTEEFKEDEHPRDNDGKFGSGGGSSKSDLGNLENALKEQGWDVPQHHLKSLGLTDNDSPEEAIKRLEQQEQDYDAEPSNKLEGTSDENPYGGGIHSEDELNKKLEDTKSGDPEQDAALDRLKFKEPENKMAGVSDKDLIKQIKGGSKEWKDWGRNEKTEDAYAEIERRNKEVPRPKAGYPKIFRDDPDAVSKMEQKIKVIEDRQAYWKQITKFPNRDYQNRNQLGDYKWFEAGLVSTQLREAKKKLAGIKAQQERGTTLTRKPTYQDGRKNFYYKEEPKEE